MFFPDPGLLLLSIVAWFFERGWGGGPLSSGQPERKFPTDPALKIRAPAAPWAGIRAKRSG